MLCSLFCLSAGHSLVASAPINNACTSATQLQVNAPNPLSGATLGSGKEIWCGSGSAVWPGVWYTVMGTGSLLTVSTCTSETNYDTRIAVQSSCSTINQYCIPEAYPGYSMQCNNNYGTFYTFQSVAGTSYKIFISGYQRTTGRFGVAVYTPMATTNAPPINSACTAAQPIVPNAPAILGTTVLSTGSFWCGQGPQLWPGAYFSVTGTGNLLGASTCGPQTDYLSDLAVQTNCTGMCVSETYPGFKYPCENANGLTYFWQSELNQEYFIFVSGITLKDIGTFALEVIDLNTQPTTNLDCEAAYSATSDGSVYTGSTVNEQSSLWCGDTTQSSYVGVWYTVIGTGNLMVASTCYPQTNYYSDLAVTMSCAATACVSPALQSADLPCSYFRGQTYAWNSTAGQPYYIFVAGINPGSVGDYGFSVTDYPEPSNNLCNHSIVLPLNGNVVTGTTFGASDVTMCGSNYWPGVWYAIEGTGQHMTATTCFANVTNFHTDISIQTFCEHSTCVNTTYQHCPGNLGTTVTWKSVQGQTYYIAVMGLSVQDIGNFGIQVYENMVDQSAIQTCANTISSACQCNRARSKCVQATLNKCNFSTVTKIMKREKHKALLMGQHQLAEKCKTQKKERFDGRSLRRTIV